MKPPHFSFLSRYSLGILAILLLVLPFVLLLSSSVSANNNNNNKNTNPAPPPEKFGQLPQVGNGQIAFFVNETSEFLAGIFNGKADKSHGVPFPASTNFFLDCAYDSMIKYESVVKSGKPSPFEMNFDNATVSLSSSRCNSSSSTSSASQSFPFAQRWWVSRKRAHLIVTELDIGRSLTVNDSEQVNITRTPLQKTPLPNNKDIKLVLNKSTSQLELLVFQTLAAEYTSPTKKGQQEEEEEEGYTTTQLIAVARTPIPSSVLVPGKKSSTANRKLRFLTSYVTTLAFPQELQEDPSKLADRAKRLHDEADKMSTAELYLEHTQEWVELWEHRMETDSALPQISKALKAWQYQILVSLRKDTPFSTSPGGLSTVSYNRNSFWDEDLWVGSGISLTHPDLFRTSIIQYRLNRLAGAKLTAKNTIFTGADLEKQWIPGAAAIPWQSAVTGQNTCPPTIHDFAKYEIHVTADVVLSFSLYYDLTHNNTFLEEAWDMLNATSLYWVARSTVLDKNSSSRPSILQAVGPDEYHLADDEIYTNYAVRLAVGFTLRAARLLGKKSSEIPHFDKMQELAANLTLLYNSTRDIHPEFRGYFSLNQSGQVVKQADVSLLNSALNMPLRESTIRNDLDYYSSPKRLIPNDSGASTMTYNSYCIGYQSIGDFSRARDFFFKGTNRSSYPPFWQFYQNQGGFGCYNFISGVGGILQIFWNGFAGIRISEKRGLTVNHAAVALPPASSYLLLKSISYLGHLLDLRYEQDKADNSRVTLNITLLLPSSSSNNNNNSKNTISLCAVDYSENYPSVRKVDDENGGMISPVPDAITVYKNVKLSTSSPETSSAKFLIENSRYSDSFQRLISICDCQDAPKTIHPLNPTTTAPAPPSPSGRNYTTPIIIACVLVLVLMAGIFLVYRRRRNQKLRAEAEEAYQEYSASSGEA